MQTYSCGQMCRQHTQMGFSRSLCIESPFWYSFPPCGWMLCCDFSFELVVHLCTSLNQWTKTLKIFICAYLYLWVLKKKRPLQSAWEGPLLLGPFLVPFPTGSPPRLPSVHETQKPSPVDFYGPRQESMFPHTPSGTRDRLLGPCVRPLQYFHMAHSCAEFMP